MGGPRDEEWSTLGFHFFPMPYACECRDYWVLTSLFLPPCDARMYRYLYQWGSQSDVRVEDLPVVPLLGSMVTGPEVEEDEEFVYVWRSQFPELEPPRYAD